MTATANAAARKELQRKFCMKDCLEIIENHDRDNVKLFSQCLKYNTSLEDTFFFLIMTLKEKKELCDRYLIFCPAFRTCSKLYTMFRIMFNKENIQLLEHIEMYHSKTTDDVKKLVKEDMNSENGKIRVLIATSAAGNGVNFKGVKYTVNYGCPRDMDTFVQQYGRAGRDGGFAMSLLIYTKRDVKNIDDDMKLYVDNETICRRENILSSYKSKPMENRDMHMCCDVCNKKCQVVDCEKCISTQHPYYQTKIPDFSSDSSGENDHDLFSDSDWD